MNKEKNKYRIMPSQKTITEPLCPVSIEPRNNQITGNIEMDIKVISFQHSTESSDNFTVSALTVFDGISWEEELVTRSNGKRFCQN